MVLSRAKKIVVGSLILTFFLPVGSVGALSEKLINKYSNYQIYFYNSEQACTPGSTIPGGSSTPFSGNEVWDGSCTKLSATRADWIKKQVAGMQAAASASGIPWELLAGQSIQESGGAKAEACDNNPLGMKAKKGHPACSNGFAKFGSYQEAYQYYIDSILPIREVKNRFPNDPYSAVAFIQYGASHPYASCDSESYSQCVGHMGEPTPGYVNSVSSIMCGIQEWAKGEGIAISSITSSNYSPSSDGDTEEVAEEIREQPIVNNSAKYCNEDGLSTEYGEYEEPEAGNLADFIKKWAWSDYKGRGSTDRMPAYAEYMDTQASYHPSNGVDCGAFVANIMRASGWDPNYVQGNTVAQKTYLQHNWTPVSTDSLKLGDVGIKDGHVILYAGNIDGFGSNTVSASQDTRAPMAGADKNLNIYTWYRKM